MKKRYLSAVGLMVIIALVLVTRALLFLHPSPGDGKTQVLVLFQSVDKISAGTRVTFAGKPVGEVKRVDAVPNTSDQRQNMQAPIFPYAVLLAIDSSVTVYRSDEISVKTSGLMGERFIAITPRPAREGAELKPVTLNDVMYASQTGSVEETFGEISGVARKADETMEVLIRLIERNQEGIYQMTKSVQEASSELGSLLKILNQERFGEQLSLLGSTAIITLEKVNRLANEVDEKHVVSKLATVTDRLDLLASDLDNYGLLFHLNRDWQREKYVRQQTPSNEFNNLEEAMGSLHQALSKTQQILTRGELSKNPAQRQQFSSGLKQVQNEIDRLQQALQELDIGETAEMPQSK